MAHYTAFIITSEITPYPSQPSQEQLHKAAREATNIVLAAIQNMDEQSGTYPETLSIGCRSYRFIQGNLDTNNFTFANTPHDRWPQLSMQFWSQNKGANLDRTIPDIVLENCWSRPENLITLALDHHNHHPIQPYPQMLIEPDGTYHHHLGFPDTDVFDDPSPGGTVSLYLKGDPASAWYKAMQPLRDIAKARFRHDYLRALAGYMGNIVIELDWNL